MRRDTFTVEDLCWLLGGFSDNLATNVLVRRIGIEAVTATSTSLGFVRSALLDRVRDDRGLDDPWTLSAGCAGELSALMAKAWPPLSATAVTSACALSSRDT
jgi:beta-lactamase class A